MPRLEAIKNSFIGGEISPYVLGRTDLEKYHSACESIQNFIVKTTGGLIRRFGSRYIVDAMGPSRLIPFVLSNTQTYILEFGNKTLRFYTNDGQIQSVGVPVQVVTPYDTSVDDLWDIKFVQVASVMYIVHPNHPPQKLIRISDTNWQLIQPSFFGPQATKLDQDVGSEKNANITISGTVVTASANVFIAGDVGKAIVAGTGIAYISSLTGTTSTDPNTGATLYPKANVTITDPFDLLSYPFGSWKLRGGPSAYFSPGSFNTGTNQWSANRRFGFGKNVSVRSTTGHPTDNTWQTVSGGVTVNVTYTSGFTDSFRDIDLLLLIPFAGGYGQITTVTNSTTVTITILAIPTVVENDAYGNPYIAPTAPGAWYLEVQEFLATNFPRAVALFGDRVYYASTPNNPQTIWGSGVGDYENFAIGSLDSSAVRFTINSGILETILWMEASQGNLILGTFRGEYIINGGAGQQVISAGSPITPTNINVIRQSEFGVSRVQPINIENDLVFIQRSLQRVYEFSFNALVSSYSSRNLTILNEVITTSSFKEMTYQQYPYRVIWFNDLVGNLVGLTYEKSQDVWAWHRHFTGTDGPDSYVSIANIPTISSGSNIDELWMVCKRIRNGVYVYTIELLDSSLNLDSASHTIFGNPVSSISGLGYLNGRTVYVVADGALLPSTQMSAAGTYTFPPGFTAKDVQAGLNYTSKAVTVRPEPRLTIQGLVKRWLKVWARLYQSLGLNINNQPIPFTLPTNILAQSTPVFTGDVNINNLGFDRDGRITILQPNPLACNLLSIFGNLEISDGI